MKKLPASVQEIAEVIGRERALFLIGQLPRAYDPGHPSGQVILYVPKSLRVDHPLVRILGFTDAQKLVRAFPGEILQPASCRDVYRHFRDASIDSMLASGIRAIDIAELMGVSEKHVRNRAKLENPQEAERVAHNDNARTTLSRRARSL